jgi:hypothetical protein
MIVAPGTAGIVTGGGVPGAMKIAGIPQNIIVSAIGFSGQVNAQFMHTLKRNVYIYVFGDRVGSIMVDGYAFMNRCSGNGNFTEIIQYYRNNNLANLGTSLSLAGGYGGRGYLTGYTTTFADPSKGLVGFRLQYTTV